MKLLFSLFNYFPHGGQQRNCLLIAQKCAKAKETKLANDTSSKTPENSELGKNTKTE